MSKKDKSKEADWRLELKRKQKKMIKKRKHYQSRQHKRFNNQSKGGSDEDTRDN